MQADEAELRIGSLTERWVRIGDRDGGWTILFENPDDGSYWELTHPESGVHGGGPRMLCRLSAAEVHERYPSLYRRAGKYGNLPKAYTEKCMDATYVESRNGGYYIGATRVSLDSIVYAFRNGESAEAIQQNFAALTLEQVYGAIAFYLKHQAEVDANIREGEAELRRGIPSLRDRKPEAFLRLQRARESTADRS
jgi:uncharacterized protein (DUF433 family)